MHSHPHFCCPKDEIAILTSMVENKIVHLIDMSIGWDSGVFVT